MPECSLKAQIPELEDWSLNGFTGRPSQKAVMIHRSFSAAHLEIVCVLCCKLCVIVGLYTHIIHLQQRRREQQPADNIIFSDEESCYYIKYNNK